MESADSRRALLEKNGFALSQPSGKSMRPLLWSGEHCVVVKPLLAPASVGDMLMFLLTVDGRERQVVHRVIGIENPNGQPLYITRGDNCLHSEAVNHNDVIGIITEVHRLGAYHPWHVMPMRRFAVTDGPYKVYCRIWSALWPLRRFYYALRARWEGRREGILSKIRFRK